MAHRSVPRADTEVGQDSGLRSFYFGNTRLADGELSCLQLQAMNLQRYRSEALEKAIEFARDPLIVMTVPPNTNLVDGLAFEKKPDILVVSSKNAYMQPLHFSSLSNLMVVGEGRVDLKVGPSFAYVVKFSKCTDVSFTGDIHVSGGKQDPAQGSIGISVGQRSSDIEIAGIEVSGTGFAGIMAKDDGAFFGEFVMRNISIHDCKIHHTGGEGVYIGNSALVTSGKRNHLTENVHVFKNHFYQNKWDAIQTGCGVGSMVYQNLIEDFGIADRPGQRNGIQFGMGTSGECYDNTIRRGRGNGVIVLGTGVTVKKNRIFYADESGVFSDVREGTIQGHKFIDNTIISPKTYCLACRVKGSLAKDNKFLNPGVQYFERIDTLVEENNYTDNNSFLADYLMKKS